MTVRNALFSNGLVGCTEEMADMVINAGWMTAEHAQMWLRSKSVPASRIKQVALVEQGPALLRYLADTEMFSEQEAIELMYIPRMVHFRAALHRLFDLRPSLIPAAVATGTERLHLVEAAVGSRHLQDRSIFEQVLQIVEKGGRFNSAMNDVMLTLLANPNTPDDIVARGFTVSPPSSMYGTWSRWRPASNQHIVMKLRDLRMLRKQLGPITTSWESAEGVDKEFVLESIKLLGANRYPSINDWFRASIGWSSPTVLNRVDTSARQATVSEHTTENVVLSEPVAHQKITKEIIQEIQHRIDPLGVPGWSTFWSLVDTWQGSVAEILDATVELSK